MTREIRLNAFDMNCVVHQSPGLWRHPADQSSTYKDLDYWVNLARTLERGKFDGVFIADVLGVYDVLNGSNEAALRNAAQVPVNDPLQLISAMAYATENLGFGITASISFEHPYTFARRMSTADHLTKGRLGWNIVTSYLESGAKNIGQAGQTAHDDRYDLADEYMEVVYKLWEGSWEDGAVIRDRQSGIYTRPEKVHPIAHDGKYFKVPGIHLSEPSPQRTPLLYQAGASSRGRVFAGAHAECVFISSPSKTVLRAYVKNVREEAEKIGRNSRDLKVFNLQTVVVGETDAEAQRKFNEYRQYASYEGALTLISGWTGVDFGQFGPDEAFRHRYTDAVQSAVATFTRIDPDRTWTVKAMADWVGVGGFGPVLVGSPSTVADLLEEWVADTDVDGFNLAYVLRPQTFEDVVDLLVPELQRRGVYKKDYGPGTLREKLIGRGPRLEAPHPGARYRDLAALAAEAAE